MGESSSHNTILALRCCLLRPLVQIHSNQPEWTSICSSRYALPRTLTQFLTGFVVGQLPQTSYHALQTPYAFFGLGRTNNYIENLFVGSTKTQKYHFINMEGVIPNSKVVISPPVGDKSPSDWKKELYLRPSEWIPLVSLTVVIATLVLAVIWFVLYLHEKVSLATAEPCSQTSWLCLINSHRGKMSSRGDEAFTVPPCFVSLTVYIDRWLTVYSLVRYLMPHHKCIYIFHGGTSEKRLRYTQNA